MTLALRVKAEVVWKYTALLSRRMHVLPEEAKAILRQHGERGKHER